MQAPLFTQQHNSRRGHISRDQLQQFPLLSQRSPPKTCKSSLMGGASTLPGSNHQPQTRANAAVTRMPKQACSSVSLQQRLPLASSLFPPLSTPFGHACLVPSQCIGTGASPCDCWARGTPAKSKPPALPIDAHLSLPNFSLLSPVLPWT